MTEFANTASNEPIPQLPLNVHLTFLENGLAIIVREDHSAPVVSAQAWCMAGSVHEGKWLGAGLSHVLEHMLFKGTTSRPGSRIDQEVQEAGGYMNAFTSFDRTVYHIDVPNTGARVAIDILCDIMQHATLPADELEKEKQVIVREMDMNVDDPARRASRRLFESAYTKSPYRFTVIGYPDIFHEVKHDDLLAYYREKYSPNNVFYVIAGDLNARDVVQQVREAYSQSKARAIPPVVLPVEPPQTAPREILEEAPIELGHFHMAWHIPDLRHPDVPVLDVLAALLGHGRSSRLFRKIREALGLAHSVDAWIYSPGASGLFGISAVVDGSKFLPARREVLTEVEAMKGAPASAEELNKAVKQFVSGMLSARKTMQGQAQDLGANWLAANDLSFSERYLNAVKRVSPADIQRVALKYLRPENRTIYGLLPLGAAPKPPSTLEVSPEHPIQKFELPNGLRLLVKEDHRLPFVEFRAVFQGGVLVETPQLNGITTLMSRMLLKGTKTRSAEDIATQIESVGGSIDSYGGNNSYGLNAEVLSSDFNLGLELLADVLLRPAFSAETLQREREVQLANLREQRDHLLQSAFKAMRSSLFGQTGYGLDALGTEASLQKLQAADLAQFHQQHSVPNNCVLAIYGDIHPQSLLTSVKAAFGDWKPRQSAHCPPPSSPTPTASNLSSSSDSIRRVAEFRDKKQAVIVVGFSGTTLHDPDRYALELLQETCSDLGSRLFLRVREKLGLAYYVGAQNVLGLAPGFIAFYAGTLPEKIGLVEQELLNEAELLRQQGLTEQELHRAKAKIIGQKKIARQELGGYAIITALDELYGLGYAHTDREDALYNSVTLEDVRTVAQKYLNPNAFVIATIAPKD